MFEKKNRHANQPDREFPCDETERLLDEGEARGLELAAKYLGPVLEGILDKRLPGIKEHEERINRIEYWMGSTPKRKIPYGQIYLYIGATVAITTAIILYIKNIL